MELSNYPNIVCTEGTLSGSPRIEGRRLSVGDIVFFVHSDGLEYTVTNYEVDAETIQQAIEYCAHQQCIKDEPYRYCHNCTLRAQQEPALDLSPYQEITSKGITFVKGPNEMFMGTLEEFKQQELGTQWWKEAKKLLDADNTAIE